VRDIYSRDHLNGSFLSIQKKVTFGKGFFGLVRAVDQKCFRSIMLCRKGDFGYSILPQASRKMFQMAHKMDAVAAKKTKERRSWDTGKGKRFARS